MTRANAKDYIKSKMADYLQSTGRPLNKAFSCPNPSHDDAHPSAQYDQKSREKVTCFSRCGQFDIFDLIGFDYGLNEFSDQFKKACEIYSVEVENDHEAKSKKASISTGQVKEPELRPEPKPNAAEVERIADYIARCRANLDKYDYLQKRGISLETAKKMGLGYDFHFKTKLYGGTEDFIEWQALIIQTGETSYTARNMASNEEIEALYPGAEKKERYRNKGMVLPFNLDALTNSDKPIFIVEGEIDALSIIEAGGSAIGIGGTSQVKNFAKILKAESQKGNINQTLVLAFDNDEPGENAAYDLDDAIFKINKQAGIEIIKHNWYNIAGNCKDANEALLKDRDSFIKKIQPLKDAAAIEQAIQRDGHKKLEEKHIKEAINGKIQNFVDACINGTNKRECYSTGIASLDHLLDGGLYSGLYFVGALSGLGKTTFALNVSDYIAKCGHDVLYFSLEMGTNELIAKSVSRHTLLRSIDKAKGKKKASTMYARTTREIMTAQRRNFTEAEQVVICDAMQDYYSYAGNHIYIYEGVGDIGVYSTSTENKVTGKIIITKGIRERVEEHIKIAEMTGNIDKNPLVVIDYLQILAPYDNRATDKQNTDKSVVELKRMSRDFNIPVICISAFNRENYNEPVSMASFRESSAIEYGADCLIGLQYEGMDYEDDDFGTNGKKKRAERLKILRMEQEVKAISKEYQDIELKVLKNRNGIRGTVRLDFAPAFNHYRQKQN